MMSAPAVWAMASTIRTPGMTAKSGKWPTKCGSLMLTALCPTALSNGTISLSRSTNRKGGRCGTSFLSCSTSRTMPVCPLSPMAVTFRLLCQVRQCLHFAQPFADGFGGLAAIIHAAGIVAAGRRGRDRRHPRMVADSGVVAEADLAAQHDEVAQFAAAGDADLTDDDVVT